MLIALLILVVVSLLGISAMKTSLFASKVATGTQADAMVFEGAETAISEAYKEFDEMNSTQLSNFMDGGNMIRCVEKGAPRKTGLCAGADYSDARGLIKVSSDSSVKGYQLISGAQVSATSNGGTFVDYQLEIQGTAEMPSFSMGDTHVQDLLKRGIKPNSEID
ncbi:hypothetical protein A11A3_08725 [Alcanivorax hongdengensis A-11-3]|uniref:Type 4 fimbrial biogenesis protein PilX N-terminal domain-containing protein n=1 Tax=Alcanivorax hongdengensis A-11-3 TaxID=1177179 RepID=L0WEB8_9GAMM|nr:hypothetical protein A11A3_08725 [Alcanivorax hongdengensis A-11-3]